MATYQQKASKKVSDINITQKLYFYYIKKTEGKFQLCSMDRYEYETTREKENLTEIRESPLLNIKELYFYILGISKGIAVKNAEYICKNN